MTSEKLSANNGLPSRPASGGGQGESIQVGTLLKGANEVRLQHGNCIYTLRITRQGKLILTK